MKLVELKIRAQLPEAYISTREVWKGKEKQKWIERKKVRRRVLEIGIASFRDRKNNGMFS